MSIIDSIKEFVDSGQNLNPGLILMLRKINKTGHLINAFADSSKIKSTRYNDAIFVLYEEILRRKLSYIYTSLDRYCDAVINKRNLSNLKPVIDKNRVIIETIDNAIISHLSKEKTFVFNNSTSFIGWLKWCLNNKGNNIGPLSDEINRKNTQKNWAKCYAQSISYNSDEDDCNEDLLLS